MAINFDIRFPNKQTLGLKYPDLMKQFRNSRLGHNGDCTVNVRQAPVNKEDALQGVRLALGRRAHCAWAEARDDDDQLPQIIVTYTVG